MTASSKTVGGLGSDGKVNIRESPINVVMTNKPKLLTGLNQKVSSWTTPLTLELHGRECCRRIGET